MLSGAGKGFRRAYLGLPTSVRCPCLRPIHNDYGVVVAYAERWPNSPTVGTPKYWLPTGFRKGWELFNHDGPYNHPRCHKRLFIGGFPAYGR